MGAVRMARAQGEPITEQARDWLPGDPYGALFYDALSAMFPAGENFLMKAVRGFRSEVTPELALQIGEFLRQEAAHSREHMIFNEQQLGEGPRLKEIVTRTRIELSVARRLPPVLQLAMAAALEHLTAIIAYEVLTNPAHLKHAQPAVRRLWVWHAIEELEHKCVAIDTFNQVVTSPLKRWCLRNAAMIFTTRTLAIIMRLGLGAELARSPDLSGRGMRRYLFKAPGLLRRIAPAYGRFLKPGFHPAQQDDSELVKDMQAELYPTSAAHG
jgi:predicted metal-dependent hydrolase